MQIPLAASAAVSFFSYSLHVHFSRWMHFVTVLPLFHFIHRKSSYLRNNFVLIDFVERPDHWQVTHFWITFVQSSTLWTIPICPFRSCRNKGFLAPEMNQHRRRVAGEPPSTSKRWQSTTKTALEEVNALRSSDDREVMIKGLAERKMANTQTSISFGNEKVKKYESPYTRPVLWLANFAKPARLSLSNQLTIYGHVCRSRDRRFFYTVSSSSYLFWKVLFIILLWRSMA